MSRKFQELGKPRSAWIEVAHEGDLVTIAPDPQAPHLTLADVERPGEPLTDEEVAAEFGDIPVDAGT